MFEPIKKKISISYKPIKTHSQNQGKDWTAYAKWKHYWLIQEKIQDWPMKKIKKLYKVFEAKLNLKSFIYALFFIKFMKPIS
jgi:hypothetical protein